MMSRPARTLLAAAAAFFLAGPAAAADGDYVVRHVLVNKDGLDWWKVGETDDGDAYFVDVDSLKADGSTRLYRGGVVYAYPTDGDSAIIMEERIDCTAKTIEAIYLWTMDSDSKIQKQGPLNVDPVPVAVQFKVKSIREKILGLCQRAIWPISH